MMSSGPPSPSPPAGAAVLVERQGAQGWWSTELTVPAADSGQAKVKALTLRGTLLLNEGDLVAPRNVGLMAGVGIALVTGATWARFTAIVIAGLSIIANFLWLPYYPWWSILIIALDIVVIWAVSTWQPKAEYR